MIKYVSPPLIFFLEPALLLQGCTDVTLLNRSRPRAETLAASFPEVHFDIRLMPDLMRVVAQSDVVFVASGSDTLLIHGSDLSGMPPAQEAVGSVRRFFDISVPRNVSPDVSQVECSRVFNVDDLKEVRSIPCHEHQRQIERQMVLTAYPWIVLIKSSYCYGGPWTVLPLEQHYYSLK